MTLSIAPPLPETVNHPWDEVNPLPMLVGKGGSAERYGAELSKSPDCNFVLNCLVKLPHDGTESTDLTKLPPLGG